MQHHIDYSSVAEHGHRVPVVGGGDDVGQRAANPAGECLSVHGFGKMTGGHPGPVVGTLGAHLLERHVMRQAAVVLGQPFIDVDIEIQGRRHGFGGLKGPPLRTADQAADREPGQPGGEPPGLFPAGWGQLGIGTLAGLRAKRQRMANEQQLHGCNDRALEKQAPRKDHA